jgi:hypothetical protein
MSSELSFASESMALRFRGRSSIRSFQRNYAMPSAAIARMSVNAPTKSTDELTTGMP